MRRKLTKAERLEVYNKTSGHCAYCGCELPLKGFHVDHIQCLRNHEGENEDIDTVKNMFPACGSCNIYKRTMDIETFRNQLSKIPSRLSRDASTYDIAVRYGLIKEAIKPITFYFEQIESEEYKPMCPYGHTDCVWDRNYIKHFYPDWYKELGEPTNCEYCVDGSHYDDEDK